MAASGWQWLACVLGGAVLVWVAGAEGEMAVDTWVTAQEAKAGSRPGTVRVLETGRGAGVIRVDLSALPAKTRVYRARLFVRRKKVAPTAGEALVRNEIFPLRAPLGPDKRPQPADKPLSVAPPAYDCFDATDDVRARLGSACELLVKSLPGWIRESTRLEVAYEGKTRQPPMQVRGLHVFHRAGQTFITWKEVEPIITSERATWGRIRQKLAMMKATRSYRIYLHDKPINAATIARARLIARVGPLSGYNQNGRNMEYLIAQAMIQPDEMGELARDYNGYMYTWGMNSKRMDRYPVGTFVIDEKAGPLPGGTGLYVHHPATAGRRCYAVVYCKDGRENTVDFSPANALAKPVAETVGLGQPVRQGPGLWGPYFDYPGRRQVYVQWCAPPLCPRPSMYFNWSILVPPDLKKGRKAPGELYFHSGNFSYAKPRKKYLHGSIQIAPHDYPFSGWYGLNDAWGTLKSWKDGVVRNHTQRRIVAFLAWAAGKFPLDPDRILLPGGEGAVMLALAYPEMFSYLLINKFDEFAILRDKQAPLAKVWGPKSPDIKDQEGRAEWGWAMLDQVVRAKRGRDLPLIFCRGYSWGPVERKFARGEGRFYDAMRKAGQPIIADWTWARGYLIKPDKYTGLWRGMDMTRTTPVPAFANCSTDRNTEGDGQTNLPMIWQPIKDSAEAVEITIHNSRREATVDLALRRLQKFKVKAGEKLAWEGISSPLGGRKPRKTIEPQGGTIVVDDDGVFVLKTLRVTRDLALNVKVTRAK